MHRLLVSFLLIIVSINSAQALFSSKKKEQPKQEAPIKLEDKDIDSLTDIEKKRFELRANEQQALEFIFPSVPTKEEELAAEKFYTDTEKDQLLELWRATIARNRTIQFVVRALSTNPNDLDKNNAIMQSLSKALFVPFYAVASVTQNALISGGTLVGARVVGDVVDNTNQKSSRTRDITKTEIVVMFMLVDEVAQRLRDAYYGYKQAKIENSLTKYELIPARLDAAESLQRKADSSIFFTRLVVRDLERKLRQLDISHRSFRRVLVELAGEEAVDAVDVMIDVEVGELLNDINA